MSKHLKIEATLRENAGRGSARAARNQGLVPAVIYGNKQEPQMINIDFPQVIKAMKGGQMFTKLCDVSVDGKNELTLARDIQLHPVNDLPMHIDFMRVTEKTKITVDVPVHFLNEEECKGLTSGGVLNVVRHTIELKCAASSIPEAIEIDLTEYEQGDAIHVSAVKLPKGAELTVTDRDFTIATIATPRAAVEVEETDEGTEEETTASEETAEEGESAE